MWVVSVLWVDVWLARCIYVCVCTCVCVCVCVCVCMCVCVGGGVRACAYPLNLSLATPDALESDLATDFKSCTIGYAACVCVRVARRPGRIYVSTHVRPV